MTNRRVDLFGRWVVLAALLAGGAALFAHEVITRRAYDASLLAMTTVTDDTLPTIVHLSELRRVVRDLDIELALADDLQPTELLRAQVEQWWPVIDEHLQAYLALPASSQERPMRRHLLAAVAALRGAERRLLVAPDEAAAGRVFEEQVVPSAREVRVLTDAIVLLNSRQAARAAQGVLHEHEQANDLSRLLLVGMSLVLLTFGAAAYRALARAERVARSTLEELDAFAGRVAHDLKGPLQPALLAVNVLEREEALSPTGRKALGRLDRGCRQASALIDGLLAFARAGAAADPTAAARVDEVVLRLEGAWRQLALEEGATIDVDVEPRSAARASEAVVTSIVDNLARNALLHLGPVDRRCVSIRARQVGERLELDVTDSGQGIPADMRDRIFRPFERGSDRPGGSGLGLATVKRLVDAHGGTVELSSRLGEGTTVRVRLPLAART